MSTRQQVNKRFKIRLKKGDKVIVRAGKYKGTVSTVTAVHPQENKVTVEGVNVIKRHIKPTRAKPQGGIVEMTKPFPVSKVGFYDEKAKKATRIGYKIDAKGVKTRVAKSSGKEITS